MKKTQRTGWRPDDEDLEIPGLLVRRLKTVGATLSAYPDKKRFTWEVEMGDLYAHGRAKSMEDAQDGAENCLQGALQAALLQLTRPFQSHARSALRRKT